MLKFVVCCHCRLSSNCSRIVVVVVVVQNASSLCNVRLVRAVSGNLMTYGNSGCHVVCTGLDGGGSGAVSNGVVHESTQIDDFNSLMTNSTSATTTPVCHIVGHIVIVVVVVVVVVVVAVAVAVAAVW